MQVSDERGMTHKYSNTGSFFFVVQVYTYSKYMLPKSNILAHVFGRVDAVLKRNGVDQKMGKVFE